MSISVYLFIYFSPRQSKVHFNQSYSNNISKVEAKSNDLCSSQTFTVGRTVCLSVSWSVNALSFRPLGNTFGIFQKLKKMVSRMFIWLDHNSAAVQPQAKSVCNQDYQCLQSVVGDFLGGHSPTSTSDFFREYVRASQVLNKHVKGQLGIRKDSNRQANCS